MELGKFRNQVDKILRLVEKGRHEEPGTESKSCHYHDRYQTIAADVLKRLIEPRMEIIAEQFDDASLEINVDVGYARLSFFHQELPAVIYLLFCLRLDYSAQVIKLYAESCLNPFSMDYKPTGGLVMPLSDPDLKRAEAFIEKQILQFVKGYLRVRRRQYAVNGR